MNFVMNHAPGGGSLARSVHAMMMNDEDVAAAAKAIVVDGDVVLDDDNDNDDGGGDDDDDDDVVAEFKGCWRDDDSQTMKVMEQDSNDMTNSLCIRLCKEKKVCVGVDSL